MTLAKTKKEALHLAMSEVIRQKKREKLKSLSGKIQINLDREKREDVELAHQKQINSF